MGRHKLEINWEEFEKLCGYQCTLEEIASWYLCSGDTIERAVRRYYKKDFAEVFAAKRKRGRVSLRRKQYQLAMTGNCTMLIWLGKQMLKQTDKVHNKNENSYDMKQVNELLQWICELEKIK
jgi:hypothetical protein